MIGLLPSRITDGSVAAWIAIFAGLLFQTAATNGVIKQTFVATECFGNVLSLSCKSGHRIKVLDDFFGVSERLGGDSCMYKPGDCTVTNNRYTSVIHRYCEGKQSCTNFQVDRRYCGINQTNYEQVEYGCVPDREVSDFCIPSNQTSADGYIATPNFPDEYPANLHCTCSLRTDQSNARIQLESTHFIVKFDEPCKDWVDIATSSGTRRRCGAYRSTLVSDTFTLTFHSDEREGHQGLWLYYSVIPDESDAKITVHCKPERYLTTTTPKPPTTPQPDDFHLDFKFDTTTELDDGLRTTTFFRRLATSTISPTFPPVVTSSSGEVIVRYLEPDAGTTTPYITSPSDVTTASVDELSVELGDLYEDYRTSLEEIYDVDTAILIDDNVDGKGEENKRFDDIFEYDNTVENNQIDEYFNKYATPTAKPTPIDYDDYINTWERVPKPWDENNDRAGIEYDGDDRKTDGKKDPESQDADHYKNWKDIEQADTFKHNDIYKDRYLENGVHKDSIVRKESILRPTVPYPPASPSSSRDSPSWTPEVDEAIVVDDLSAFRDLDDYYDSKEIEEDETGLGGRLGGSTFEKEKRKRVNRTTGIIIISICVGGILLLIAILSILLCISKRKRPEVKEKEKKEKLQERLNSLSFYDSIPMYESIGRRGGVARAPPLPQDQPKSKSKTKAKDSNGGAKTKSIEKGDGESPYWTSMQPPTNTEHDSDHDSAIYAELDKNSAGGESSRTGTPSTLPKHNKEKEETVAQQKKRPAPPPPKSSNSGKTNGGGTSSKKKKAPAPDAAGGFALDLDGEESEAVYTHV